MLGYYALVHVLIGWFGDGAFVIRLPSVIAAAGRGRRREPARSAPVRPPGGTRRRAAHRGQPPAGVLGSGRAGVRGDGGAGGGVVRGLRRDRGWAAPARAVDRLRRPHHALGVRELRRDLRAARATARPRVAADRLASGARRDGGVRGVLDPAGRARAQPRFGPAVLDRAAEPQARAAGHPGAHLGRLRAELPADRRRHPAGDPDRGAAARRRSEDRPATPNGDRYWRCRGWSFRSG